MKIIHDRRVKSNDFQLNELVLKLDAKNEEKGRFLKHYLT